MTMAAIISAENVGKMYRLRHQQAGRYTALRDVIVQKCAAPFRSLAKSLAGSPAAKESAPAVEDFWALKDVSFEIQPGEVVGIIGRNGAGKSTLLKLLSRITEPTTGCIRLRGRVASLLEVGTGFHPELTGRENIFLNGAILGMTKVEIKKKFDEIVAFSEVERFLDTPVKRYSSGMYVRLAFAVAAHLEPEILIVDEVLAVGDAQFQKKCLGKMQDVARESGRTVLFVSHNMTAVKSLCSRAILLEAGRIETSGDPQAVVRQYLGRVLSGLAEREWTDKNAAPGGEKVRLRKVRIVAENAAGILDVDTSFKLEIEFWNLLPGQVLNASVVIYTADDVCVLNTTSKPGPLPGGLARAVCHFPANFFNDGAYRVRLLMVSEAQVLFDDNHILSFDIADGVRPGGWYGKWVGVVRPQFQWDVGAVVAPEREGNPL